MAEIHDDRSKAERLTHTWLVIGTDRFLSGWGGATGGNSYAAWACRPEDRDSVLSWVSGRSDMMRIREASEFGGNAYRPGASCAHLHVYVVGDEHPARGEKPLSKRELKNCKIRKHGEKLQAIFPNTRNEDPVKLCKKLRRWERTAEKIGLRLCNDPSYSSREAEDDSKDVLHGVCRILGFENGKRIRVFVNRDPRGYALKICDEDVKRLDLDIHRDMGGYGIIAPEIS